MVEYCSCTEFCHCRLFPVLPLLVSFSWSPFSISSSWFFRCFVFKVTALKAYDLPTAAQLLQAAGDINVNAKVRLLSEENLQRELRLL